MGILVDSRGMTDAGPLQRLGRHGARGRGAGRRRGGRPRAACGRTRLRGRPRATANTCHARRLVGRKLHLPTMGLAGNSVCRRGRFRATRVAGVLPGAFGRAGRPVVGNRQFLPRARAPGRKVRLPTTSLPRQRAYRRPARQDSPPTDDPPARKTRPPTTPRRRGAMAVSSRAEAFTSALAC